MLWCLYGMTRVYVVLGFISGIGHSLGRLAGSRKNGSRKLSRPTAMELHDRLIHVDNGEDIWEDCIRGMHLTMH